MENKHKEPIKIFTALDLEMNQPSGKIIQIGAVVGNILTGEIIDKFRLHVNPHEQLGFCNDITKSITDLTGITQEEVDNAPDLEEAYKQLREFHKKHNSFINPITWGGGDAEEIRRQLPCPINKTWVIESHSWPFGRRWIDVKTLYVSWRLQYGKPPVGGLAKAMTNVGLKFEGRKHDAESDALNTFRMYKRMLELFKSYEGETND